MCLMDVFYALAEPRRRKIIELLAREGQLSATQIYKEFNVTAQAISQHLKILLDAKLLNMEKRAQQRLYSLNADSMLEVEEWASQTTKLWEERFDSLERVLETQKRKNAKNR
ncbi:MAG: winged helix-turn-helix transcriptional regulator [Candidatus Micrarchaeota archaeon]|nr:winged helix-turn-helix transcriptional regulator [Candidatus Micrarchaeota archaeon]